MPRAYPLPDYAEPAHDRNAGEWQALRGELVALLDKVESHYSPADSAPEEPAMSGLSRRVRDLCDQMNGTETSSRRREALRTVKRAVDRFSEREAAAPSSDSDDLSYAIAEIRSRQGQQMQSQPARRAVDNPEIRELSMLVGGMSHRLERLEGDLKSQRSGTSQVQEVAGQVEQLTQVVELLAGAIGETGQVKRLEAQIAALGMMIEDAPKVDLVAINARLDDVSATVGKLAELQAQQMEREIAREKRHNYGPELARVAPAMDAIELSVRSVYDRIDAIERSVALSAGDFERLTSEMAAFTQAMHDNAGAPDILMARLEGLSQQLKGIESPSGEVLGLKADIESLRETLMEGMEPRFLRLESQIEALNEKIVPVDTSAVEAQLKVLMARMDDAGAQLDGLARLYAAQEERPDFEELATMVAERASEAMSRKVPPPVAVFGPESLKSIEDRITGLIKSAGKTPDYESLADMIAVRASEAVTKAAPAPVAAASNSDDIEAMEQRMTALFNTAGKDTAERLARLEAALTGRTDLVAPASAVSPAPSAPAHAASAPAAAVASAPAPRAELSQDDPFAEALEPRRVGNHTLDAILADLDRNGRDAMPENPAEDGPLIDRGPKPMAPARPAAPKPAPTPAAVTEAPRVAAPLFDPSTAQKPPRPKSSFALDDSDPFAEPVAKPAAPQPEVTTTTSNTSTFVAAARRAQRARQEEQQSSSTNSVIGRALARVKPRSAEIPDAEAPAAQAPVPAAEATPSRKEQREAAKAARAAAKAERVAAKSERVDARAPSIGDAEDEPRQSFLTRHRRPLLLAATLVAVSMLALNLVLQRSSPPASQPVAASAAPQTGATETNASPEQTSMVPPRVIDLVDPTATGSINPGEPMSFSRATITTPTTLAPSTLTPVSGALSLEAAPETTGSIAPAALATPAESFDLPPEAVGPLALREAAAKGNPQAQFEVAAIFGEGRALEKDLGAAASWYERSAAQGFVPAQYRMGNLYELGSGVEKDLEQARLWYQRAAEAGNRMAMHNLAALYAGGEIGEQQFELAAEWFEKAAEQGMTDSQFNLGMLYARGLGVDQSFEQSYKWFSLAALSGDKDATQARSDIAKSLTAEAVSRIDAEVESWKLAPVDFAANFAPMGTWSGDFDPGQPITTRDVVLKVQLALAKLGFDVGTPDGVSGPKTSEAIKAFETATGMSAVGAINPRLLAVLGSQPV
ncbi:MAG: hypothetical protein GX970_15620 [Phyllobacteriaceae bacterium]|nr:hypothetical protein [Phyllobacteriaceae bacterium]